MKSWTNYEIRRLKTMLDNGLTHGEIAEVLGRTVYSIKNQVFMQGFGGNAPEALPQKPSSPKGDNRFNYFLRLATIDRLMRKGTTMEAMLMAMAAMGKPQSLSAIEKDLKAMRRHYGAPIQWVSTERQYIYDKEYSFIKVLTEHLGYEYQQDEDPEQ